MSWQSPIFSMKHATGAAAAGVVVNLSNNSTVQADATGAILGITLADYGNLLTNGWLFVSAV